MPCTTPAAVLVVVPAAALAEAATVPAAVSVAVVGSCDSASRAAAAASMASSLGLTFLQSTCTHGTSYVHHDGNDQYNHLATHSALAYGAQCAREIAGACADVALHYAAVAAAVAVAVKLQLQRLALRQAIAGHTATIHTINWYLSLPV
jgi:hypothetical protein